MVDLAGFTALTEAHGDDQAADLAMSFTRLSLGRLGPGDRLVKSIGDAVLLASSSPASGLTLVAGLLEDCAKLPSWSVARAGLHHGPAVERDGDLFGASVNLTARVAGQAAGGHVLATRPVADVARDLGVAVRTAGSFRLRNVADPCELFELDLDGPHAGDLIDPVCRMRVDPSTAGAMLRHGDEKLWFCSTACASAFIAHPERHAGSTGS
jgi:class 3 adenylate cyclase